MARPKGSGKYRTPKEFWKVANQYLTISAGSLTINGLVQALGFVDRHSLLDYKEKGFSLVVKRAVSVIEAEVEAKLLDKSNRNVSGPIFWLKNHRWSDKQEMEVSGSVENIIRFPIKSPIGAPVNVMDSDRQAGAGS
jgi:hypothetical protein